MPGLGRSTTTDWDIAGGHMAERCGLFIIIALGESVLVTGATFAELEWNSANLAAFVCAFLGSVAMWWIYFNIGAEKASHLIAQSADPGRVGPARLHLHAYLHRRRHHRRRGRRRAGACASVAATWRGRRPPPFSAGRRSISSATSSSSARVATWLPLSHLVGLAALAALVPAAPHLTPLLLGAAASGVLVVVAIWETLSLRVLSELKQAVVSAT